jgi:hypothetical protein
LQCQGTRPSFCFPASEEEDSSLPSSSLSLCCNTIFLLLIQHLLLLKSTSRKQQQEEEFKARKRCQSVPAWDQVTLPVEIKLVSLVPLISSPLILLSLHHYALAQAAPSPNASFPATNLFFQALKG